MSTNGLERAPLTALVIEIVRVQPALERFSDSRPVPVGHREPCGIPVAPLVHRGLTENPFEGEAQAFRGLS